MSIALPKPTPRTRPLRRDSGAALFGGLIGMLLTESPFGFVGGAAVGAKLSESKLPLEDALRFELSKAGWSIVSYQRLVPRSVYLSVERAGEMRSVVSTAPDPVELAELDDWLFADILERTVGTTG